MTAGIEQASDPDARQLNLDADIVIVCKNEARHLRACLESVLGQHFDGRFAVTVIDSGSTDGSLDIIRSLPVTLIQIPPHEFHHARTRNLGGERSTAPVLVYLNGDAIPVHSDWLSRISTPLLDPGRPDVAGVYGRQIARVDAYPMERFMLNHLYGASPRVQRITAGSAPILDETLFSTVNCAVRRDFWAERPFSDRVQMSEDQEWSRYWLTQGKSIVYDPESSVVHSHNNSLSRVFRRYFDSGVSSEESYLPRRASAQVRFGLSGVRYLAQEATYLAREGYGRWLPYAALYESLKVAGLALGRQHRLLPSPIRKRLTYFG